MCRSSEGRDCLRESCDWDGFGGFGGFGSGVSVFVWVRIVMGWYRVVGGMLLCVMMCYVSRGVVGIEKWVWSY